MATKTVPPATYAAGNAHSAPQILSPLDGVTEVPEGEPVHLELRVSPPGDLQVQWFRDGHPLSAVALNSEVQPGFNNKKVIPVIFLVPPNAIVLWLFCSKLNYGAQMVGQDQMDAQWADRYEATSAPTREYERDQRNQPKSPPQFAQQPVISSSDVLEGEPVRIEAHLVPTSDATLHVEWLRDGQPVGTGSRFNAVLDRGLVVLEIGYCLAEDSGHYVCVASNALGQEQSHPIELR
ncbi:unnamed protein product [Echinostoma caproni]|uniref:Ig-like domain-containing protein n=1 Tax=Echinostoma caproni TaxID=27848 RepID=A0A183ASL0_9TREM|nr:unnamed protein product [Echinostoma caproni]